MPAITVTSEGSGIEMDALERAFELCRERIERTGAELGPRIAPG